LNTPLYYALKEHADRSQASFHMPGHKSGYGLDEDFYKNIFRIDLTELADTDNLHAPDSDGAVNLAQKLAAEAFGSLETRFLVNGSTCGIYAAIMATCCKGDTIIVSRDCHKSVFAAINFIEAEPIYMLPEYDERAEICTALTKETIVATIKGHPEARAVVVTRPTYYGYCCDIEGVAELAERYGMFLIVDEAHGAHLNFSRLLPESALKLGAHMCVQSAHKTLPALTQTAYLHINSNRVEKRKVEHYLRLFQTSSPSYILMSSLDIARAIMQEKGELLIGELLHKIGEFKKQALGLKSFTVLEPNSFSEINNKSNNDREHTKKSISGLPICDYSCGFDSTRLVITITNKQFSGYTIDRILREKYGVWVEMSDERNIVCIATVYNKSEDFGILASALYEVDKSINSGMLDSYSMEARVGKKQSVKELLKTVFVMDAVFKPYEVLNKKRKTINIKDCEGEIAAEMLVPFPPGIPLVMPGEKISIQLVNYLSDVNNMGGAVMGLDKNGNTSVVSMG